MSTPARKPAIVTVAEKQFYYRRADRAQLANLPAELAKIKFWVVWEERPSDTPGRKYKKVPLNALTLAAEGWGDPKNWSSRATAIQVFEEKSSLRGIGCVFSTDDPYLFFDLDQVIRNGKVTPWADEFVKLCDSYTEVSATGAGIKIIMRATLGARRKSFEFRDSTGGLHEVEVYDANRFFAATGDRLEGTPPGIRDGQDFLDQLHSPTIEEGKPGRPPSDRATDQFAAAVDEISDQALIERIQDSKQGKKFTRLFNGSTKGYPGYFAASGALCAILAFWTRANPERIDRIYRRSKLFEESWWTEKSYCGGLSRADYIIRDACRIVSAKAMYTPPSTGLITNDDGKIKPIVANAITMLKTTATWQGVLAFNRMTLFTVKLKPPPWEKASTGEWADHDDTKLTEWFERHGLFIDSSRKAGEAAQAVAHENEFHPVLDYLTALTWDESPRLDAWLSAYLGAADNNYTRAVGRCWLLSAVARVFRPGCQADYTLLLEGAQGILKSSALCALAGDEFFLDNISEIESKDALLKIHAAWIVELAELAGLRRSDVEKIKSFLTSRTDKFRAPYDRRINTYPRMNVFAASVNDDTPFTDETGNRRFWPVKCGTIDLPKLKDDRNQLWAEAVARFKKGEEWWLTTPELNEAATAEQYDRYSGGQWDGLITPWLKNPTQRVEIVGDLDGKQNRCPITPWNSSRDEVTIDDVLIHVVGKKVEHWTHADKMSIAKCLKHNGWACVVVKKEGIPRRIYVRPGCVRLHATHQL